MSAKALKIAATSGVLLLALTGLMFTTLREDTQFYKHVDEVMADPSSWHGKRLQLHGYVEGIERKRNSLDYRLVAAVLKIPRECADPTQIQDMVDAQIPVKVTSKRMLSHDWRTGSNGR